MDHSEGVSVYAEAKAEYTKQLCQYLVPSLHKYFLDMLDDAKEKEPEAKKLLLKFQAMLEEITDWNKDKVQRETTAISNGTQCDYLEELLAAVFIAHTKVLSAIRLTTKQKKLQITIPKLDHFLHRTLTECARILWSNTYLFSPGAPSIERQRNLRQIETLLHDGVLQSIRGMLPVKNILREYLHEEEGSDEDEEDEKEEGSEEKEAVDKKEEVAEEKEAVDEEASAAPSADALPTLVVDTDQPISAGVVSGNITPSFSGQDTNELPVLEEQEPPIFTEADLEEAEDASDGIVLMEEAPEPLDEFEDIDAPSKSTPAKQEEDSDIMAMDFETLE
jgi:hypothetical protein